jgi:tetratricopeptide (TPR) repeat protein
MEAAAAKKGATSRASPSPLGGVGIAAMATAVTKKKEGKGSASPSPVSGGGIAAMAAAAANGRASSKVSVHSRGDEVAAAIAEKKSPSSLPAGGGIAAMAAMAAKKKNNNVSSMPLEDDGIAAMVAVAAKKKGRKDSAVPSPVGGGSIAAMAAAAAKGKASSKVPTSIKGGSIATRTAATAAKKSTSPLPSRGGVADVKAGAAENKARKEASSSFRINPTLDIDPAEQAKLESKLLSVAMEIGAAEASSNPRNLPSFYCLFLLAKRLEQISPGSKLSGLDIREHKQNASKKESTTASDNSMQSIKTLLLLQSLAISNQASSFGMVGWLEYGSSNPLERSFSLPFEVLHQLAYNLAADSEWHKASDVLNSLVIQCEQHLPSYHPKKLSSMLDLATALAMGDDHFHAKATAQRVSYLAATYLSEHETMFFDNLREQILFENDSDKVFLLQKTTDSISMIKSFTMMLNAELSRDFLNLIGPENRIALLNHSLVADSFAVLANCISAGRGRLSLDRNGSHYYWSLAYMHYQISLKGWTKVESLSHPNAASAAYSIARCLREFGRLDQALKILNLLVSSLKNSIDCDTSLSGKSNLPKNLDNSFGSFTFLSPRSLQGRSKETHFSISNFRKEQSLVLCLWMMAILTVDQSPDERGRIRALSLLHGASDTLRSLLRRSNIMDISTKRVCFELYESVEEEARNLFEPIRRIRLPLVDKNLPTVSITEKLRDSLTATRSMRWQHMQPSNGGKSTDDFGRTMQIII